jgi:hypothetical protein
MPFDKILSDMKAADFAEQPAATTARLWCNNLGVSVTRSILRLTVLYIPFREVTPNKKN